VWGVLSVKLDGVFSTGRADECLRHIVALGSSLFPPFLVVLSLPSSLPTHRRYRNFRTLTTPTPVQFTCLAIDSSGEIVCAGALDPFNIYVWSLQTGEKCDAVAVVTISHQSPFLGIILYCSKVRVLFITLYSSLSSFLSFFLTHSLPFFLLSLTPSYSSSPPPPTSSSYSYRAPARCPHRP
jgi:hypothetical protein